MPGRSRPWVSHLKSRHAFIKPVRIDLDFGVNQAIFTQERPEIRAPQIFKLLNGIGGAGGLYEVTALAQPIQPFDRPIQHPWQFRG